MSQDQARLTELYQEQGYAFALVSPDRRINDSTRIVDVTYHLRSGEKASIRRIEFQGNRETRDFVLRREFLVRENELFNGQKLRESNSNLRALGYFKPSTALDTQPTEVNNVLDIVTKVEEAQTGTLQGQIGFSDVSGLTAALSVTKANLGGRGQTIRAGMEFAQRNVRNSFTFDFIEPHLFGTDFSSSSSLAYSTRDDVSELNRGLLTEMTASQGFGYLLLPRLQAGFSVEATNREFQSREVHLIQLRSFTSSLTYRSVNNPTFPSDGSLVSVASTQVGGQVLRGTTEYRRYRFSAQRFFSLNASSTLILMGRMRLGWLEQVGDNEIPVEDRFRIGGLSTVHGYSILEIGGPMGLRDRLINSTFVPTLDASGNPVLDANGNPTTHFQDRRTVGLSEAELARLIGGGIQDRVFNVELLFPLASDNVRGVIFYDAGNVNAEHEQYRLLHEKEPEFFELLAGYGGGIRLISPVGVLRFEYGIKALRKKGESGDRFDFTISTLF
jgi:outer membrane protein insertion porin family